MKQVVIEKNKLKRAWIWFWYNDITRIIFMLGIPAILITFTVQCIFGNGSYLKDFAISTYIFFFVWMIVDNDYSNLRRIGLDEYRRKI